MLRDVAKEKKKRSSPYLEYHYIFITYVCIINNRWHSFLILTLYSHILCIVCIYTVQLALLFNFVLLNIYALTVLSLVHSYWQLCDIALRKCNKIYIFILLFDGHLYGFKIFTKRNNTAVIILVCLSLYSMS